MRKAMFRKTKKGYYMFDEFKNPPAGEAGFKSLIHGFSSRKFGDCSPKNGENEENIEKFLATLGLERKNLVAMEQIHGHKIKVVGKEEGGKTIPGVDGIITTQKKVALGVKTADCLPILFYDPGGKIIGAAHAGWRGVLKKIPQKMVEVMIRLGSLPEDIIIGIGPHIGGCCYNIDARRAEKFRREFGELKGMMGKKKNLNLAVPAVTQLVHTGILRKNIILSSICTFCHNQEFFSYRKDSEKTYGEMLGVISLLPERQ